VPVDKNDSDSGDSCQLLQEESKRKIESSSSSEENIKLYKIEDMAFSEYDFSPFDYDRQP